MSQEAQEIVEKIAAYINDFTKEVQERSGNHSTDYSFFWEAAGSFVRAKMNGITPDIICYGKGDDSVKHLRWTIDMTYGCRAFAKAPITTRWAALKLIKTAVESLGHECRIDWVRAIVFAEYHTFKITIVIKGVQVW